MASRFANNDAQRSLRRVNGDIAIDKGDMRDFLNIAKAHMAAGNAGDAVTVLTAIGRLDERTDVREDVKLQNAEDRKLLLAELDARGMKIQDTEVKEENPDLMPKWAGELFKRIKAVEAKEGK
tara:strand:+ start:285 stop:653 length:369 start_codon:yes stop_codon:yes gene_type:complete